MNYQIDRYRKWLIENVRISDAYSLDALRKLTLHVLMGQPLVAIYRHLQPLVTKTLTEPPIIEEEIWKKLESLPDSVFIPDHS